MSASSTRTRIAGAAILAACWLFAASADGKTPPVPPGVDPGGLPVAFIGAGLDMTAPDLTRRLARDGEGNPIGRDLIDGGPLAHGVASSGTAPDPASVLRALQPTSAVRAVVVRADSEDVAQLARAITFVAATPARVVVLPIDALHGPRGELARQAALRFRQLLFIVALAEESGARASDTGRPVSVSNLLLISNAVDDKPEPAQAEVLVEIAPTLAKATAADRLNAAIAGLLQRLACLEQGLAMGARGAELKAALLAAGDVTRATGGRRGLSPAC